MNFEMVIFSDKKAFSYKVKMNTVVYMQKMLIMTFIRYLKKYFYAIQPKYEYDIIEFSNY